jgi:hypothetical protein
MIHIIVSQVKVKIKIESLKMMHADTVADSSDLIPVPFRSIPFFLI